MMVISYNCINRRNSSVFLISLFLSKTSMKIIHVYDDDDDDDDDDNNNNNLTTIELRQATKVWRFDTWCKV